MSETSASASSKSNKKLIAVAIITLLLGGLAGYFIGANMTEDKNQEQLEQEVSSLQQELEEAKAGASDEVQEGADAITEGQQTLEALQAENATLKATIEQQNQKIADLEKQLADAQTPPTN